MINFRDDVFIYKNTIFVNDPSNFVDLSLFDPNAKRTVEESSITTTIRLPKPINDNPISGGDVDIPSVETSVEPALESSSSTSSSATSPTPSADNFLSEQISIVNSKLMKDATPIWKLQSSDYSNVLHDFEHYKNARFAISFGSKIPDDVGVINADMILSQHKVDVEKLHRFKLSTIEIPTEDPYAIPSKDKSSGNSKREVKTRSIPLITFPELCLFKTTTILELQQYVAFQLRLNITQVTYRIRDINSIVFPYTDIVNGSEFKWNHNVQIHAAEVKRRYAAAEQSSQSIFSLNQDSNTSQRSSQSLTSDTVYTINDLTSKTVSIGSNPIIITIKKNDDSRSNIYEELFYRNYNTTASYYKHILDQSKELGLPKIPFSLNISQVSIQLIYKGPSSSHSNVNIVKLFNMNHVSEKCSKIYIQSQILDDFKMNPRQMQYIKTFANAANHFKGIESLYNTCSFYMSKHIVDPDSGKNTGVVMYHLDVAENMTLTFTFTNTDIKNRYEDILSTAIKYIALNALDLIRMIKLNEAIYNTEFKPDYYVPVISSINASFTIANMHKNDMSHITSIMNQDIPNTKFSTRSSLCFSSYSFYNLSYWYKMMYLSNAHEFLTTGIIFKDIFPTIHIIVNEDAKEMTVTLNRMASYDNLVYSASLIIGSCKHPSAYILEDALSTSNNGTVDVEAIRRMAKKSDKKLLKLLTKLDPVLFGPRYVGTKNRSYSGLCQKKEQRPVPISDHEYDELIKNPSLSQSLTRLQNQTYPEQTICLFCADKEYSFLNYHHFPNQKCIVRCTSKSSNKTQYDLCTKALNAQNVITINNKFENQTITLYNPLITKGRKCRVPEEIKDIFTGYVLIKLNLFNISVETYCKNTWDKHAFVIQREMTKRDSVYVCSRYYIRTDFSKEFSYVLILKSENDESYFAFITEGNNPRPFELSKNNDIREFFMTRVQQTNDNNNFMRFLENVLHENFGAYASLSMKEIIRKLREDFHLIYIVSGYYITGVIINDIVYFTPQIYWFFDEESHNTINMFSLGSKLISKPPAVRGVDVTTLDPSLIKTIYIDYESKRVRLVKYDTTAMLVEPFDITAKYANIDIIYFDYNAYTKLMAATGKTRITVNNKDEDIRSFEIGNVINTYIYIYLMNHETITKEELLEFMTKIGAITNGNTYTNYCDKSTKNFISWRNSKINKDVFLNHVDNFVSFNVNELITRNYEMLYRELETKLNNDEDIKEKIITS